MISECDYTESVPVAPDSGTSTPLFFPHQQSPPTVSLFSGTAQLLLAFQNQCWGLGNHSGSDTITGWRGGHTLLVINLPVLLT